MWASLVAQMVKNPPAVWETWVQSLGWEDPLAEGMATRSSILAWRIPVDRGAWWPAHSMGSQRVGYDGESKHSIAHSIPHTVMTHYMMGLRNHSSFCSAISDYIVNKQLWESNDRAGG